MFEVQMMKLCDYGCGQEAKYQFKNEKWCCNKNQSSCPIIRKKNSDAGLIAQNRPEVKAIISQTSKASWAKQEVREKRLKTIKEAKNNTEGKEARSKQSKDIWSKLEIREKIIQAQLLRWNKPNVRERACIKQKEVQNRADKKEKLRQFMLNGGAAYANPKVRNLSWPQTETYSCIKLLYNEAVLNHVVKITKRHWYVLDIVVPDLMIDIEYDGSRYHEDIEKDNVRDRELEILGYKVIRYRDKIPSTEQLRSDISGALDAK
jgi:very-short-patch-repair endonuclease